MEAELPAGGCRKFPVWIIEHVWAHRMMDIQEVLDPCSWPDVDSQPLSLEDSWRLRVASARVYSIVKSRDVQHFETALRFLEATFRLLPRLVAAIKHMKIMFGLKTMVIMWMLKQRRGMVETVSKIVQFFPTKLPQYQDQCSQREMFLMRKNHEDFKGFAQTLAMDKNRLEDYMKDQMEDQYGEHYAQKVEDRLLLYLQQLEAVLPGDTYIDTILKKQSPVTEEEKLLLEVINSDSSTIATTLKKLLHCDVASCRPATQAPGCGQKGVETCQISESARCGSSPKGHLESGETKTPQPDVGPEDSPLLLESSSDAGGQPGEDAEVVEKAEGGSSDNKNSSGSSEGVQKTASSSPQFCCKHQRWVKSILNQCPDECSEELQLQANISSSPLLFPSSSSTSSSKDLTPSDLVFCPPGRPPSQTATQTSEPASPRETSSSGSTTSETEPRNPLLPNLLSLVVPLVDIASLKGSCAIFKPHPTYPDRFIICRPAASASSPQIPTLVAPSAPEDVPASTDYPLTRHTFSRMSPKFGQEATRHLPTLTRKPVDSSSSPPISTPVAPAASQDVPTSTYDQPSHHSFSRLSPKFGHANSTHLSDLTRKQEASAASPQIPVAAAAPQDEYTSIGCPPTRHTFSRLSRKFRQVTTRSSPVLTRKRASSASSPPLPTPVASPASEDTPVSTDYPPTRHTFSKLSRKFGQATTRHSQGLRKKPVASASGPQKLPAPPSSEALSTSSDYPSIGHSSSRLSPRFEQATSKHSSVLTRKRVLSASSPPIPTPVAASACQGVRTSNNYQPSQHSFSRLSRRFRQVTTRSSPILTRKWVASASSPPIPVPLASEDVAPSTDYPPSFTRPSPKFGRTSTRHSPALMRKRVSSYSSSLIPLVAPASEDESGSTDSQPTRHTSSRLSPKFGQTTIRHSVLALAEQSPKDSSAFQMTCPSLSSPSTHYSSGSMSQSWSLSSVWTANTSSTTSSQQPQSSIDSQTSRSETPSNGERRAQPRLSLPCQAVLLQSKLLQPFVRLTRLSVSECKRASDGRASTGHEESMEQSSNEDVESSQKDDADSSFDVNWLFSSSSSDDSVDSDSEYRPHISKKRLLLEYENARTLTGHF